MDIWGLSVSIWSFSLSSSGTEGWTRCFFHFFGILCNQGQKIIKRNHYKILSIKSWRMALWRICGWYLWLLTVCQYNFTASLIKALHALTRVSISNTEGKTRILDVELQNKILLCAEEKSRVVSAVCAAQALGNRCLASINILISAPTLQTTFSLSTEMSSEWRSGRSPAMRASTAWVKGEPRVSLAVKKKKTWWKQSTNNFKWIWIIWNERRCVSEQLVCLPGLYVPGEDGNSINFCHQMVLTLMNNF